MTSRRRTSVDWARLNHVLLPEGREARDQARQTWLWRTLYPVFGLYDALTDEGRFALVLTLVVGAASLDVQHGDSYVLFAVLAGTLLGSLVVSRWLRLDGVTLSLSAPRRVTVGEPLTFTIVCANRAARPYSGLQLRGPFLPWDGTWLGPRPVIEELPPNGVARVAMRATFVRRGEHHLDPFSVAILAPGGLALGRRLSSSGLPFLAVPRLANVERVDAPRALANQSGGAPTTSRTGASMELLGVRPYRPGDAARDLHARSWARTGSPVVREYQEESFRRIGVLVDGTRHASAEADFEALLSLAAGIVARLRRDDTPVDLFLAGDAFHHLALGPGLGSLDDALDALATAEARGTFETEALARRLTPHLAGLSALVFVAVQWDGRRRELREGLQRRGVSCQVVRVTPEAAPEPGVVCVSAETIRDGNPIAL